MLVGRKTQAESIADDDTKLIMKAQRFTTTTPRRGDSRSVGLRALPLRRQGAKKLFRYAGAELACTDGISDCATGYNSSRLCALAATTGRSRLVFLSALVAWPAG